MHGEQNGSEKSRYKTPRKPAMRTKARAPVRSGNRRHFFTKVTGFRPGRTKMKEFLK